MPTHTYAWARVKNARQPPSFCLQTVAEEAHPQLPDLLQTVFENGELLVEERFEQIRERAALQEVKSLEGV